LYSELAQFFEGVERQKKFWGLEFDVSIPSYRVAFEVDGYPWHLGKEARDKRKDAACQTHGWILIRLRDDRLPPLGTYSISYSEKDRDDQLGVIVQAVGALLRSRQLEAMVSSELETYLGSGAYAGDDLYRQLVSDLSRMPAERSLRVTNPDLAAQWNQDRNVPLTPDQVSLGSGLKVWWKCKEGHEWQAPIYSRPKAGCPYCANKRVTADNSLAAIYPEVAKQWHPTRNGDVTPDAVGAGSGKVFWWRCAVGHEWMRSVERRTKFGRGCPYCAGRLLPDVSKYPTVEPKRGGT